MKEIRSRIEDNLYRRSNGRDLPFRIHIHAVDKVMPCGPVPRELSTIDSLCEYKFLSFPPSVYFLVKDSKVFYVGKAVNLPSRLGSHHISESQFDRVLYLPVPPSDLDRVEKEFIVALDPSLNKYKPKRKMENK